MTTTTGRPALLRRASAQAARPQRRGRPRWVHGPPRPASGAHTCSSAWNETVGLIRGKGGYKELGVPWPEHELATELRGVAASLPHRHTDAQGVRDNHRKPAHGAVPNVRPRRAAFSRGARFVSAGASVAHAERAVQRLSWRCVDIELVWQAEDLCRV